MLIDNKDEDEDKEEQKSKDDKDNSDDIEDFLKQLSEGVADEEALKKFENQLKEALKEQNKKHRLRSILIYLFFAVTLFFVNLAAFGFLSSYLYVSSWYKGIVYILAVTIISLLLTLLEKGLKLIPGFVRKDTIYFIELIKPVTLFVLMLIANYKLNYVVFDKWYIIVFFLLISYSFQFAITYYRIKHKFIKLL